MLSESPLLVDYTAQEQPKAIYKEDHTQIEGE